jgi:RNA polymerase sigma factor (TIGR02999 family)
MIDRVQTPAPGRRHSTEELIPLVYEELRGLAAQKLAQEPPGQTLQPTALVHEVFLRLADKTGDTQAPHWAGRTHFYFAAAEAMRRILVDNARRKRALKRGGDLERESIDDVALAVPETPERLLALDEALEKLETVDPDAAQLVKLRCFSGLSLREAAEMLEIPGRTADRLWAYARAWLSRELSEDEE